MNRGTMHFTRLAALALTLSAALMSCNDDTSSTPQNPGSPGTTPPGTTQTVHIPVGASVLNDQGFGPEMTVTQGTTVMWVNDDTTAHTVTSDDGTSFASGLLNQGDTFSHVFNEAGDFPYHCIPHPNMTGMVHVTGTSPSPSPSESPGTEPSATPTTMPSMTPPY